MSTTTKPVTPSHPSRPAVSDVQDTLVGRCFSITFGPGQELPSHSNPSRVSIVVVRGTGTLALGDETSRPLIEGDFVQLESNQKHAVTADDNGLELLVTLVENCCQLC